MPPSDGASPEVMRKVEEEAQKHESFHTDPALAYYSVGYYWSQCELEWDIGLHAFNVSLSIDPRCILAHFYRGIALVELKRSKEALVSFLACCAPSSLSQLMGEWEDPYYESACVYRELRDQKKALELLNLSVKWNKGWDLNHIELAEILLELGEKEKATSVLEATLGDQLSKDLPPITLDGPPGLLRTKHLQEAYRRMLGP